MSEHDHLIAMLNRLKLTALRDQLDSLIDEAGRRDLTIRDALALFCEREIARRDQRRIDMSFGLARFPFVRDLAGFDFGAQPSIDRAQVREIATGRFIANGEAVLLLGPPGVGKTHLAVAIGQGWPKVPAAKPLERSDEGRGDCDRLHGAVHAGDDVGGATSQGAWRWPPR
jgi:DNA replication protein DnaC